MHSLYKTKLFDLSRLFLFLEICSINLREPFFHLRELFFLLFLITSIRFIDYRKLLSFCILVTIWCITVCANLLIPGSNHLNGAWYNTLVISIYLILLCTDKKDYYNTIISAYKTIALIVSIIIIGLWILCFINESLRIALQVYFTYLEEERNLFICGIDTRRILGVRFFSVYYRTAPCIIPALSFCLVECIKKISSKKTKLLIVVYTVALFFTGARANMMTALLLIFFYLCFVLISKKLYGCALLLVSGTIVLGIVLMFAFLGDGTGSTSIKKGHQISYHELFETDMFRTYFYGWGAGSTFYSKGRHEFVELTELSHLETIRRYGFISAVIIFVGIWLRPALTSVFTRKGFSKYFYLVSELAYIFAACTNPFLLDSVGFCALLFFSTYINYFNELDKIKEKIK